MITPRRTHALFLLLGCAVIWGLAFLFQKAAMAHIGPFTFIAARSFVGSLALAPLACREIRPGPQQDVFEWRKMARQCLLAGVVFFLASTGQQVGLVTATISNAGFLTALYVVLTPVMAWMIIGKKPSVWVWPAVGLSFIGTWLLGGGGLASFATGDYWVAGSAVLWAWHVVLVGQGASLGAASTFTAGQFFVSGLCALVVSLVHESPSLPGLWSALPAVLYVGILSSAVSFTIFAIAMRAVPAAEAAIIVSTESLFAALAGWLYFHERLGLMGWGGACLIFIATLVVQIPSLRRSA
jgi:drug/metabolite transporter (DMT)-like permease